ncbi:Uncharacterized protein TCAP_02130 [Tolypocladium capitatum]|uniref:cAMP-dependent protein kinase n=1 Tax=Tolypocladium capitatum TaxID=45235 RepID=A0A2K3QK70_9HYPO|nr:Uncharacterized protein TCAP_02130 [Tolypocladium capitatum]
MPSLGGFLKKKRTRDSHPDPSTSSSTSPVAATAPSKPFDWTSSQQRSSAQQAGTAAQLGPPPTSSAHAQVPAAGSAQQQHMKPTVAQQGVPYATQHDPQNLPAIRNLIHQQPQNDGAAAAAADNSNNNTFHSSSPYPASLGPTMNHTQSASPGTDPSRMQQQQQQQQQQDYPHPPTMLSNQQQQRQPQHQHQSSQGVTPRITKGKYSLADFEILRTLGTGSFGRVHLVQSKHNQRFYAVKVLKKAQVVKMKQVEHTNDERRMLSDVKHPFLITLWGTFQDWRNLYMVMDFVEGGELFSLLRKSGRFPNPVAKFYAAEATLALEYLHSKNIIYRDLKPENLLLDRHGHLKITDFGFAKRVPDKTWTLCGTPDYLAPEVVSNKGYNKSVDWWVPFSAREDEGKWSLGILIYEMLCGYTPFWDSGSPMRIYENILKGKVKYPAYINAEAQNLLERLITADLTKRLGNLYGGSQDVKSHAWFAEVTWDRLARKDIDAPYTPPVKAGSGDASQFDRYPEDPEKYGVAGGPDDFDEAATCAELLMDGIPPLIFILQEAEDHCRDAWSALPARPLGPRLPRTKRLQAEMDDYMFRFYVDECRVVDEATSYLEIFNYSDPFYNSCEEHPLTEDEFDNFLHQRGAFAPPHRMREGTELLSGIRLVVQKNAQEKDTFMPKVISLPRDSYEKMVRVLKLPFRAIETTAVVGPFFWCAHDQDDDDPHLQIIHRKSDVRKKGKTRGWEMMLSHSFETNTTTGYVKGTPSSDIVRALDHVRACAAQVGHPMLLPVIVFSYDLSPANDQKQRDARDWLRRLESAVSLRDEVEEHEQYFQDGLLEVDGLSRDLVECHGHVMWKRPQAYWALAREMERAMDRFRDKWAAHKGKDEHLAEQQRAHRKEIDKIHRSMLARLEFYKVKLKGLENYIHTTLERLKVQREALYNIMSQREARLNLEIAGEQRRIAHASKRDSTAMKTISLMGALFLPGTYLASVFSMSFFNFQGGGNPMVAAQLWIYFVVAIPLTAAIVGFWRWYDRRREAQYARDDEDLEKNIDQMEKDIMFHLRKRTMSKANTWNTIGSPPLS